MNKSRMILVSISILVLAILLAVVAVKTAPKAKKTPPPKRIPLVQTQPLQLEDKQVQLHLAGTVVASEEINLMPRVAGEVIEISPEFVDGGHPKKGDLLVQIDPADYQLALASAKSQLETARFNYKMELGRQEVAQREWDILKTPDATELEKELALHIPHLAAIKAALQAAEAGVKQAELNLQRTKITAPFNALVLERLADVGSQAAPSAPLARLVGTDAYWVQVSIPLDRLSWVTIPGSSATIYSDSGAQREGTVLRLLGNLEPRGRMARLLVEVKDPLCLQPENKDKTPLLLSDFVRIEIAGKTLQKVYCVPRRALHEDKRLWIARDGHLEICEVKVLWRDAQTALVRGDFLPEDALIVSDLPAPMQGMEIKRAGEGK